MSVIVLATRNKGKINELSTMLRAFGLEVKGLEEFPELGEIEETGTTFSENARIKASAITKATGLVAVADDSGLEVDFLDKAPGVYSARFADNDAALADITDRDQRNNAKLLRELRDTPEARRTARFRCVIVACAPSGASLEADGAWEGRIALEPAGENGFGYDPLFYDPSLGMTAAQMEKEQKNARSHRGRALRRLLESWPDFWKQAQAL